MGDVVYLKREEESQLEAYVCPCGHDTFVLWADGVVSCASCQGQHPMITFTVDESKRPVGREPA